MLPARRPATRSVAACRSHAERGNEKLTSRNPCSRSAAASDWPAAFQVKFFARAADAAPSRAASARSVYTRRICATIDSAAGSAQWPL